MKYLIIKHRSSHAFPVFCTAPRTHEQLANAWLRANGHRVLSAGFCRFESSTTYAIGEVPVNVITFGRSETLNLGPRPQDARLIARTIRATLDAVPFVARQNVSAAEI